MMKKIYLLVFFLVSCINTVSAVEDSFLAKENGKVLIMEGDCKSRYSPASSFKIPLSLMGFDSGILHDESNPSWPCKKEYDYYINSCKGDHNPRTWMRDSCLWYSRVFTQELGFEKFKKYVTAFNYGNMDLAGDKGQNNGLTHAWISSSLKISPEEQVDFLQRVLDQKFPLRKSSYETTEKIMFIQELSAGWKLYGKTGNGALQKSDGTKTDGQQGWFVGYIKKGQRSIVFASHHIDHEKQNTFASMKARNEALIKLWHLIEEIESMSH